MSSRTKVLAFYSPYPGAGKTTAAEYLAFGAHPWRNEAPVRMSFADPIRSMAASLFASVGLCFDRCEQRGKNNPVPPLQNASIRDILIWLGQSGRKTLGADIWADVMFSNILNTAAEAVVIDDLRLPNEYRMLRGLGARIVRITIPGHPIIAQQTEARLEKKNFDLQIENEMKSRETFCGQVEATYELLMTELAHD